MQRTLHSARLRYARHCILLWGLALCYQATQGWAVTVSKPGGAGHALLFRDQVVIKKDFKEFPTTAFTFEAWISTSDFCHSGTILSYATDSKATDADTRIADFNTFVIFDPKNLLACHHFKYIDLRPDTSQQSCHAHYRNTSKGSDTTASIVERNGRWRHLAVTWSTENAGLTKIYVDGLLLATAYSSTEALKPGGALMLGGEQDCFGGCMDASQGFFGLLDEVRIWKVVRSQDEILKNMRLSTGLENHRDLTAYWKFNDPDNDNGVFANHASAKDSSGKGQDLMLFNPPLRSDVEISKGGKSLHTGRLEFKNNLAANKRFTTMPDKSFTIEFWARGAKFSDDTSELTSQFFSYAATKTDTQVFTPLFMDDAIRIERYFKDYSSALHSGQTTKGAVSVHINSNEMTKDNEIAENWIDFDAGWLDDAWHHVAVTWDWDTGDTYLYLDGEAKTPVWKSNLGNTEDKQSSEGGVGHTIGRKTTRSAEGSLALGQDQDCYAGCYSPANSFDGDMAVLRIWNKALSKEEVNNNMFRERPESEDNLAALYVFTSSGVQERNGYPYVVDQTANKNDLQLKSNPPLFVYSDAPLTGADGAPVGLPTPGGAGHAIALHDQQVLLLPNFQDFPSTEITVEFWMYSIDACRPGVPFSYAHGQYEKQDNAFLLFDYNSWGVSVMEDEGTLTNHKSGVSSTDGNWHHIAVTWESKSGTVILYDNSKPVWTVTRAQGKSIPGGGTLVIGREQDCEGGCFDSMAGASGKVSETKNLEYGAQDFFGVIEEMRIWKKVRTQEEIRQGMREDEGSGKDGKPGMNPDHSDLVAYWKFDEGKGYTVKDVTNHGHDLTLTQPPNWEVVRFLSTCGNGIVEGSEECDDGDRGDGDGCSATCTVEQGWECVGEPSRCTLAGPSHGKDHSSHDYSPHGEEKKKEKSHGHPVVTTLFVLLGIAGVAGGAFVFRNKIMDTFPQVEAGVANLVSTVSRFLPGQNSRYHNLSIDPEELDLAPEFLSAQPSRVAPGHPGPYEAMGGR